MRAGLAGGSGFLHSSRGLRLQIGECACSLPLMITFDPRRGLRYHQKPNLAPVVVASFCLRPEQYHHEDPSDPGDDGHPREAKGAVAAGHFCSPADLRLPATHAGRQQFAERDLNVAGTNA